MVNLDDQHRHADEGLYPLSVRIHKEVIAFIGNIFDKKGTTVHLIQIS